MEFTKTEFTNSSPVIKYFTNYKMRTNFPTILIAFDNNMQISEAFKHCFSPSIGNICSPAEFFLKYIQRLFH